MSMILTIQEMSSMFYANIHFVLDMITSESVLCADIKF